jgi:hypothetical protein
MKAALLAIVLMLGFAAPAGPDDAVPEEVTAAARPDGLLVLAVLSPERAVVADPVTGRTRQRVFPGGTHCHGPLLAVGDRFVFAGAGVERPEARAAAIAAPAGRDRSLGPAEIIAPSATPGRLWLGKRRGGRMALREVGPRGVVHDRASAPLALLHAEVGGRFLTTRGTGLALGSERFRDAWFVAADAERFAWCGDPCPRLGLWSGGRRRALEPPRGVLPQPGWPGAFSPDGARLAVSVTVAGEPRFAVVDLARDEWRIVPGARPGSYSALAWSPSGRWLYLAARGGRLLASRGGTEPPRRLPIRTGGTVMSIVSTPGSAGR